MLINTSKSHTVFASVEAAAKAAAALAADDADWTYEVRPDPKGTGKAIVAILDEDGIFLALF